MNTLSGSLNPNISSFQLLLSGSQVSDNSGSITYDFGETNNPITIPNDDFFGYVLSDFSNTIPPIENVSIDSSATTLGIDSSAISFTGNSIDVNLAGLTIDSSSVLELDIEFGDV